MNIKQKRFQNRIIRYLELPKKDLLLNTKDVLAVLHITKRPEGSVLAGSCLDLASAVRLAAGKDAAFARWLNEAFAGYNLELLVHPKCDDEWNFA